MGESCIVSSSLLFLLAEVKRNAMKRMALLLVFLRILWRNMEGMTIKHLSQDLSNPVLKDEERRKQLSRVVNYLTVSKVT